MQTLPINFTVGAFPVGFRGNCQDYANALVERLSGTVTLGTAGSPIFTAQYGGPQPSTDIGPWWQNGTDLYVFDYSVGSYQPMEDQMPIGGCILWAGAGAPARYLLCQGQFLDRNQYSRLYQRIGGTWGVSGSQFALPPGGRYIRTAGYDPVTKNTYNNGQTGGVGQVTITEFNLPPMLAMVYGATDRGPTTGGNGRYVTGGQEVSLGFNWIICNNRQLSQAPQPLNINDLSYQCMNLCIRYV